MVVLSGWVVLMRRPDSFLPGQHAVRSRARPDVPGHPGLGGGAGAESRIMFTPVVTRPSEMAYYRGRKMEN